MRLTFQEVINYFPEFTAEKIEQGYRPVPFRIWGMYTLTYLFALGVISLDAKIDTGKPIKFSPTNINTDKVEFYLYTNNKNSEEPYTGRYGVAFIRANQLDLSALTELAKLRNVFEYNFTNDLYFEQKYISKRIEVEVAFATDPAHEKVTDTWEKHGTPDV